MDDVVNHRLDPLGGTLPKDAASRIGKRALREKPCALGIVDVMAYVGDSVGKRDNAPLERRGPDRAGMVVNAVNDLKAEIEAPAPTLKKLYDADSLFVMGKIPMLGAVVVRDSPVTRNGMAERPLANVPKRSVPKIVAEGDGLGEILVEAERTRDGSSNLGNLESVHEARPVVIPLWRKKHLRLVRKPAEALAMENPVAVALETSPEGVRILGDFSAP